MRSGTKSRLRVQGHNKRGQNKNKGRCNSSGKSLSPRTEPRRRLRCPKYIGSSATQPFKLVDYDAAQGKNREQRDRQRRTREQH